MDKDRIKREGKRSQVLRVLCEDTLVLGGALHLLCRFLNPSSLMLSVLKLNKPHRASHCPSNTFHCLLLLPLCVGPTIWNTLPISCCIELLSIKINPSLRTILGHYSDKVFPNSLPNSRNFFFSKPTGLCTFLSITQKSNA